MVKNAQSLHRMFYGKSKIGLNYEIEFTRNVAIRKKDFFSNKEQCGNSKLDGAMVLPEPPVGKYYVLLDSNCEFIDTGHQLFWDSGDFEDYEFGLILDLNTQRDGVLLKIIKEQGIFIGQMILFIIR